MFLVHHFRKLGPVYRVKKLALPVFPVGQVIRLEQDYAKLFLKQFVYLGKGQEFINWSEQFDANEGVYYPEGGTPESLQIPHRFLVKIKSAGQIWDDIV